MRGHLDNPELIIGDGGTELGGQADAPSRSSRLFSLSTTIESSTSM
jgi:hypothetical protein